MEWLLPYKNCIAVVGILSITGVTLLYIYCIYGSGDNVLIQFIHNVGHTNVNTTELQCQESRIRHLKDVCHKLGLVSSQSYLKLNVTQLRRIIRKFIVDDTHKTILRIIPKTGTCSWKDLLKNNSTVDNSLFWDDIRNMTDGLYTLDTLSKVDIVKRLQSYLLVLTARHPLARIESGFKGKIINLRKYTEEELTNISETNISSHFEQFLEREIRYKWSNAHFTPIFKLGHPCVIPYGFIAKTETYDVDMKYIAHNQLQRNLSFLHANEQPKISNDKKLRPGEIYLDLFSRLKNPQSTINKLMRVIGRDMELFGYKYEIRDDGVYAICNGDFRCC